MINNIFKINGDVSIIHYDPDGHPVNYYAMAKDIDDALHVYKDDRMVYCIIYHFYAKSREEAEEHMFYMYTTGQIEIVKDRMLDVPLPS